MKIEHHPDCVSWEDDNYCDCDIDERLERDQELHDQELQNEN